MTAPLRALPPLHAVLACEAVRDASTRWRRAVVSSIAREVLEELRADLQAPERRRRQRWGDPEPDRQRLLQAAEEGILARLQRLGEPRLHRVLNATGVLLHTNLGRARCAPSVADELRRVATEPVALEVDLRSGGRGRRHERVDEWLRHLTGAEAGLVVNNGAAALWLAVRALAPRAGAVVVSRGEQVAIGGSFRMPELLRTTGARMCDVGTTNKTSVADFAQVVASGDLVLKVHPSNYRIEGFHEEASLADLAALCRERGARLIFDAGSGSLYNFREFGLEGEETVEAAVAAGADVVTFSGDKLLGGPQAGLVVGRRDALRKLEVHPLMRALRCDKLALAALEETLAIYARTPEGARPALPLFDALAVDASVLKHRARAALRTLAPSLPAGWTADEETATAVIGGGSFAGRSVPSRRIRLRAASKRAAEGLHRTLRQGRPSILAQIDNEFVSFDLRTLSEDELEEMTARVAAVLEALGGRSVPSVAEREG